ncbi:hypothetical protein JW899_04040 [Candidatus Uhrbacteria bacterium]|nr:hypothetical protein [Candidatus Uhrbacteria bacterium]
MRFFAKAFLFSVGLAVLTLCPTVSARAAAVNAYFFFGDGCPHCAREAQFLAGEFHSEFPEVNVYGFEIYNHSENVVALQAISERLGIRVDGVPILIVGDREFIGYANGFTSDSIRERVRECLSGGCPDSVAAIVGLEAPEALPPETETAGDGDSLASGDPEGTLPVVETGGDTPKGQAIRLPILGEIDAGDVSLPVLAVIMGILDGFNPCATWVLLFLISLLLGIGDRRRRWLLGSVFIVASASVYFLFMSAWLNLILFLGMVAGVRMAIGLLALAGGGYSLKEFLTNRGSGCRIVGDEKRRKVFGRLRAAIGQNSLWVAMCGIIALAFAVNLVELLCSAGLPAVFTQVLAMNEMAGWMHYAYILIYITFFMIDDLILFFVAMVTLEMVGITTKYARVSRLVGGLLMLAIGLMLIFRPGWLMFG